MAASPPDALALYRRKRDFTKTQEPQGGAAAGPALTFCIQKHAATRLHYDFRLELDGVLKSWAVTRGPSLDPAEKRLAVQTEDHPYDYGAFEGIIPKGQYGGGTVMLWDRGTWEPLVEPHKGLADGNLKFRLYGEKLHGAWVLVRMKRREKDRHENWLLIKERDEIAQSGSGAAILDLDRSVSTGRSLDEIAGEAERVWDSTAGEVSQERTTIEPVTAAAPLAPREQGDGEARGRVGGKSAKPTTKGPSPPPPGKARGRLSPRKRGEREGALAPELQFIPPQLATRIEVPPSGADWVHELKLDGYRAQFLISGGEAQVLTRTGLDWTHRFRALPAAAARLPVQSAILDGEIVVLDEHGHSNFSLLQASLEEGAKHRLDCFLFDLLYLDGEDLRSLPLTERKARLKALLGKGEGALRYSEHLAVDGAEMLAHVCALKGEGIVAKRGDAPYVSGRSRTWLKIKCQERQELVIGGWTDSTDRARALGALLVGHWRDGALIYAGKVGTGFDAKSARAVRDRLDAEAADAPVFADVPRPVRRGAHWVKPVLVAEVTMTGFTGDGMVRHASFVGLRDDKPAGEVVLETAAPAAAAAPAPKAAKPARTLRAATRTVLSGQAEEIAGIRVTHPDKVLFPEAGITKRDLALYYVAIADRMLPHVANRPLSLVRCPEGRQKACFYQKHVDPKHAGVLRQVEVPEGEGTARYVAVDDVAGLVNLVQLGVLEIHPWGARADKPERPDRVFFDLDPSPEVPWARVIDAAFEVKARLEAIGLVSFVKTTGGKGLHVAAPLERRIGWDELKGFAHAFADAMQRDAPTAFLSNMSKAKRKGKIFVDYLRNGMGATAVCAYSARARDGAPVSTPVTWEELRGLENPAALTIATVPQHDDAPWADFNGVKQTLSAKARRAYA